MSKSKMGAKVKYCGHDGWFIADIYKIAGVNVVNGHGPITSDNINRPGDDATHYMSDFPEAGFWNPLKGVFVVPEAQIKEIE